MTVSICLLSVSCQVELSFALTNQTADHLQLPKQVSLASKHIFVELGDLFKRSHIGLRLFLFKFNILSLIHQCIYSFQFQMGWGTKRNFDVTATALYLTRVIATSSLSVYVVSMSVRQSLGFLY